MVKKDSKAGAKEKSLTLRKYPKHQENPFAKPTLTRVGQALVQRRVLGANNDEGAIIVGVDTSTGETTGGAAFYRNKTVDAENFVKFFSMEFSKFFELKPATWKVFWYISQNCLKMNSDEFIFLYDECEKETGLGTTTIYRALAELCKKDIIARGKTDVMYYINPMVLFNGDRVSFATTYINKNFDGKYKTTIKGLKNTIQIMQNDHLLPPPTLPLEFDEHNPFTD